MAKPTYTLEELSRKVDAISEFLNEKTDRNLLNLNTVGQAIIDGKVEVEALLEQNGYAKFTWKEDNKVASLIIQWGQISIPIKTVKEVRLSTSYKNTRYHSYINQRQYNELDGTGDTIGSLPVTISKIKIWHGWYGGNITSIVDYLTIGT